MRLAPSGHRPPRLVLLAWNLFTALGRRRQRGVLALGVVLALALVVGLLPAFAQPGGDGNPDPGDRPAPDGQLPDVTIINASKSPPGAFRNIPEERLEELERLDSKALVKAVERLVADMSSGGVVSGVLPMMVGGNDVWVAVPTDPVARLLARKLPPGTTVRMRVGGVTVNVAFVDIGEETFKLAERFYNEALWAHMHNWARDGIPFNRVSPEEQRRLWEAYKQLNAKFAELIAAIIEKRGEDVFPWIHDYQLMLAGQQVRELLREKGIDLRPAYFHHIPFIDAKFWLKELEREDRPIPDEILRELLEGMSGYATAVFHTERFRDRFLGLVEELVEGAKVNNGLITWPNGTTTRADVAGIATSPGRWDPVLNNQALEADIRDTHAEIWQIIENKKQELAKAGLGHLEPIISYGAGRTDLSKAWDRVLEALIALAKQDPVLAKRLVVLLNLDESRQNQELYREYKDKIKRLIEEAQRLGLTIRDWGRTPYGPYVGYKVADLLWAVTFEDGMNLTPKEAIMLARLTGRDIIPILGEGSGAGQQLAEILGAFVVDPRDVDSIVRAVQAFAELSEDERKAISGRLKDFIGEDTLERWYLRQYTAWRQQQIVDAIARAHANGEKVVVLSDNDGTLSPFTADPEATQPAEGAVDALLGLSKILGGPEHVRIISGRPADWLGTRYPAAHVGLDGSYGGDTVGPDGRVSIDPVITEAQRNLQQARTVLERQSQIRNSGAYIEIKTTKSPDGQELITGIAVHLRMPATRLARAKAAKRFGPDDVKRVLDRGGEGVDPERQAEIREFIDRVIQRYVVEWEPKLGKIVEQAARDFGLHFEKGNLVYELRPGDISKRSAVLKAAQGARVVVYLGDDKGDIPAAQALLELRERGLQTFVVVVRNDRTPEKLLQLADLVLDGPDGAVGLLRDATEAAMARGGTGPDTHPTATTPGGNGGPGTSGSGSGPERSPEPPKVAAREPQAADDRASDDKRPVNEAFIDELMRRVREAAARVQGPSSDVVVLDPRKPDFEDELKRAIENTIGALGGTDAVRTVDGGTIHLLRQFLEYPRPSEETLATLAADLGGIVIPPESLPAELGQIVPFEAQPGQAGQAADPVPEEEQQAEEPAPDAAEEPEREGPAPVEGEGGGGGRVDCEAGLKLIGNPNLDRLGDRLREECKRLAEEDRKLQQLGGGPGVIADCLKLPAEQPDDCVDPHDPNNDTGRKGVGNDIPGIGQDDIKDKDIEGKDIEGETGPVDDPCAPLPANANRADASGVEKPCVAPDTIGPDATCEHKCGPDTPGIAICEHGCGPDTPRIEPTSNMFQGETAGQPVPSGTAQAPAGAPDNTGEILQQALDTVAGELGPQVIDLSPGFEPAPGAQPVVEIPGLTQQPSTAPAPSEPALTQPALTQPAQPEVPLQNLLPGVPEVPPVVPGGSLGGFAPGLDLGNLGSFNLGSTGPQSPQSSPFGDGTGDESPLNWLTDPTQWGADTPLGTPPPGNTTPAPGDCFACQTAG